MGLWRGLCFYVFFLPLFFLQYYLYFSSLHYEETLAKNSSMAAMFRIGKCSVYDKQWFSSSVASSPPSKHFQYLELFSWRLMKPLIALFLRTQLHKALHFPSTHVVMLLLGIRFSRRIHLPVHFNDKCLVSYV